MKQDEMDDLLKKEFSPDFNEQIPEHFLQDINARLDNHEKKKKRRLFLIWFFSLALIAGGITTVYFIQGREIEKTSSLIDEEKDSFKNEEVSKTISSNKKSFENRGKENPLINDESIAKTSKLAQLKSSQKVISFSTYEAEKSKKNSDLGISVMQDKTLTEKEIITNQSNLLFQNSDLTEKLESSSELDTLRADDKEINKTNDSVVTLKDSKVNLAPGKNENVKSKGFSIGLFTGVSGIFSTINFNEDYPTLGIVTDLKTYRDTRRQQERTTSSWDLALRIQLIQGKMTFQTGIEFFEWGEQLLYDYNSISGINRYSYLNLPLNVGYMFEKEKFGINPFAGFSVGYGIRREGIYLNPDLISTSIVQSERFMSSLQAGAQLSYALEQFTVSVIPVYRMSLGPVINQGIVRNSYKTVGLQMGLSYRF
jgi:hypothetical protein